MSCLPLLLMVVISVANAFPFDPNNGVVELTPQVLPSFLNTHKAVFIMFYAPWCGHCKAMHPDWEKFGKGVKDVVKVGALNADAHREIAAKFGIQGFPTIKYWKMGSKKGMKPLDYQGARNRPAFHNAALAEITNAAKTVTSVEQVQAEVDQSESKKGIILFTSKTKSPPIFSVLSQSPHFKGKIAFLLVMEKTKNLVSSLGASTFPSVAIVTISEGVIEKAWYEGSMEYTPIAQHLQTVLGLSSGSASQSVPNEEAAQSKQSADESGSSENAPKETPPPRPATPVRPTQLTPEDFRTFCSRDAPKVRGQHPFCVISLSDDTTKLHDLQAHFEHDAVLFFFTGGEAALSVAQKLNDQLQPMAPLSREDVIVLRGAKDRTKFVVWRHEDEAELTHPMDTLTAFIERAIAGEITFEKNPGFPKL